MQPIKALYDENLSSSSFMIFPARILRAIRIAARLGFRMSKETAHFIKNLSLLVQRLDKVGSHYCVYPPKKYMLGISCWPISRS